jgi:hypothetical protein
VQLHIRTCVQLCQQCKIDPLEINCIIVRLFSLSLSLSFNAVHDNESFRFSLYVNRKKPVYSICCRRPKLVSRTKLKSQASGENSDDHSISLISLSFAAAMMRVAGAHCCMIAVITAASFLLPSYFFPATAA